MVTTKLESRTETHNIKKKEMKGKVIEYYHTKIIDRNTREKKQQRHRATPKQDKMAMEVLTY